jgi:hypothetical protein
MEALEEKLNFKNFPSLKRMFQMIQAQNLSTDTRDCERGMEFRFQNEIHGIPNRGWLRIFFPTESKCLLFFHKKSTIPFSRDRFSYGGVVIDIKSNGRFEDPDIAQWIEFLHGGLLPGMRPASLKKSFPYTVPEA